MWQFPKCNLQMILEKVRAKLSQNMEDVRSFFTRCDAGGSGVASYDQFRQLLLQVGQCLDLCRHGNDGG